MSVNIEVSDHYARSTKTHLYKVKLRGAAKSLLLSAEDIEYLYDYLPDHAREVHKNDDSKE